MDTLWSEKSRATRKRVVEELVKGRDMATELQILLEKASSDHGSFAQDLALKIKRSFSDTLSVFDSCDSGEPFEIPAATQVGSPSCGDQMSVGSGESSKRPAVKDRRGCYKRRKTSDSWSNVTASLGDGYAWRKYGQKTILKAKFPRCYFRCTHKHDLGCRATKQVQRIQEDPQMYQTTYFGQHTCRDSLKSSHKVLLADTPESYLLSFESKAPIISHEPNHQPSSPFVPSIKAESYKEEAQSDLSENTSSLNSVVWPTKLMSLEMKFDEHEDEISRVYSSASDMEFFTKPADFDNYFCFDESEMIF